MLKLSVYKKVNISRNILIVIFVLLLVLVAGKWVMAHEKLADYQEAIKLYHDGKLVAAEKKFREAKLNVAVTDHNAEIKEKLSILSPIREKMEDFSDNADSYYKKKDLKQLVKLYKEWQVTSKNWLNGTPIQKDMYGEMLALTGLDQELSRYFSRLKETEWAKLSNRHPDETAIHKNVNMIPAEYYGGEVAKKKAIRSSFQTYYASKIEKLISANASVVEIVNESGRQFGMLAQFSIDSIWLKEKLDRYLVKALTAAITKKDYTAFAVQASTIQKLSAEMGDANVFSFIGRTKESLLEKAKNFMTGKKFADAIAIYDALEPLVGTGQLIADANQAWDQAEPIRVLKRQFADKEFTSFVDARNKWGANSVVAAISKDGGLYFGKLTGNNPMSVVQESLDGTPAVNQLGFNSKLSASDTPVIFIDAKSSTRKHRYLAYEVRGESLRKILDIDADLLTVESKGVVVVDNPVGKGEGELSYYEADGSGDYRFTKIKVDFVDIDVRDILKYTNRKVRFTAFMASKTNDGALVVLSEEFNASKSRMEKKYLLLKGRVDLTIYQNYSIIGVFHGYDTITNEYDELVEVPVFQVEKVE
ncbi:hypothetical protein [Bacillus sp. JJ1764]|uniref:hypothetical protein n=1 Tax=Bacillus sp. JJ1764 TaxID=3122964 RepID=UPI003000F370